MAGAVILVVVVALCVHLPWDCLWRRQRSEHDVSCPITDSEKRICGKCMLHRDATKTMTYSEKPHQASVTMATSDRHYRASSGNLYSQVDILNSYYAFSMLISYKSSGQWSKNELKDWVTITDFLSVWPRDWLLTNQLNKLTAHLNDRASDRLSDQWLNDRLWVSLKNDELLARFAID